MGSRKNKVEHVWQDGQRQEHTKQDGITNRVKPTKQQDKLAADIKHAKQATESNESTDLQQESRMRTECEHWISGSQLDYLLPSSPHPNLDNLYNLFLNGKNVDLSNIQND